jgi:hypothetical protein
MDDAEEIVNRDDGERIKSYEMTPAEEEQTRRSAAGEINAAMKTVQVIGQSLRNFPGSLRGDLKREMALESYRLGLRTFGMLCRIISTNIESVQQQMRDNPSKVFGKELSKEAARRC